MPTPNDIARNPFGWLVTLTAPVQRIRTSSLVRSSVRGSQDASTASLLEPRLYRRERRVQFAAQTLNDGDYCNGDARHDEAILNRGGSPFVPEKLR
jgi:hypothetical protein